MLRPSYLIKEDGLLRAILTSTGSESCAFDADGDSYRVSRNWRRAFILSGSSGEIAKAEPAGGPWTVNSSHVHLELVRASFWNQSWEVRRFGEPVGLLRPAGFFNSTSTAELPEDLPLPLRLFLIYLAELLWTRPKQMGG